MGKLGAFELNYSSDIDLICFFDEEVFHPEEFQNVRRIFINATKNMYRIFLLERSGRFFPDRGPGRAHLLVRASCVG